MRLILILLLLTLAACAGTSVKETLAPDGRTVLQREMKGINPDYYAYLQTVQNQPEAKIDTSACKDSRCVENLSHDATIRSLAAGNKNAIQPPPARRTAADRMESLGKSVLSVLPGLAGIAAGDRASERAMTREVAQYEFLGAATQGAFNAATAAAQAGPDITVGGNLGNTTIDESTHGHTISDSGNIEDSYNVPTEIAVSGDGSLVGDGNSVNNGDNNDNSGDLRDHSDGPIDDHSCNPGEFGCDVVTNPEPTPAAPKKSIDQEIHELRIEQIKLEHQLHMNDLVRDQNDWLRNELRGNQ